MTHRGGLTFIEPEDMGDTFPVLRSGLDTRYRSFTPDHRDVLQTCRIGIGIHSPIVVPSHLGVGSYEVGQGACFAIDAETDRPFGGDSVDRGKACTG